MLVDCLLQAIGTRCYLLLCLSFFDQLGAKVLKLPCLLLVLGQERKDILVDAFAFLIILEGSYLQLFTFLEL